MQRGASASGSCEKLQKLSIPRKTRNMNPWFLSGDTLNVTKKAQN
jgi:hypothetical protein